MLEGGRLILAFGISDVLPDIPGLAERWGTSVLHCPCCHGYEFSGQRLGVLYLSPNSILNSDIAQQLGCKLDDGPVGPFIRTDGVKMTTVPGVYAAGDITRGTHTIAWATADGVTAGMALHRSLVF